MQAAAARWIRSNADGSSIVGQLVYDNPSSEACRTGFICNRAVVDGERIVALQRGTLADSDFNHHSYLPARWYAPGDITPSGQSAEQFLVDVCDSANYP